MCARFQAGSYFKHKLKQGDYSRCLHSGRVGTKPGRFVLRSSLSLSLSPLSVSHLSSCVSLYHAASPFTSHNLFSSLFIAPFSFFHLSPFRFFSLDLIPHYLSSSLCPIAFRKFQSSIFIFAFVALFLSFFSRLFIILLYSDVPFFVWVLASFVSGHRRLFGAAWPCLPLILVYDWALQDICSKSSSPVPSTYRSSLSLSWKQTISPKS